MKIIDLLNKIANGEEVPKKILYKDKIYEWKEYDVCYGRIMTKKGWVKEKGYVATIDRTYYYLQHCSQDLNDEIEILDEPKKDKIEKVNTYVLCDSDFHTRYKDGYSLKATEIIDKAFEEYSYKINEIIDKLNKEV